MKKILKWTGISFLLLFILLLAAPFIFKDKIVSKVKEEANKSLNAKLDFGKFDLSLIRSFPNFSLSIENLSIINLEPFSGDTLIYSKKLNLTVDLMSVIKGDEISIRSVELIEPVMNFLVKKDGRTNWDIAKSEPGAESAASESSFKAKLKRYSVENGRIIYHDESLDFYLAMNGVDHSGKGDFTQDLFELNTQTEVKSTNMTYEKIPYISSAKASIEAKLNMDMKNFKFTFLENKINLNALELGLNGWVAMPDTNIDMELDFSAAKSDFKNFISMIPTLYSKDFESLKSSGTMALSGFIKGRYNALSMPGFGLTLKIDNGMFQYPSLPSSVNNVFVDLNILNPDGVPDHTVIDLKKMHVEMAGAPFDAKLLLKTPVSDPDLDAFVKGTIDLTAVQKFVPLDAGTKLTGIITADLSAKGRMSAIEKQNFDQFSASGGLVVKGLEYSSSEMKSPFSMSILDLTFNPKNVNLNAFQAKSGKSDFKATGTMENFIAYALKGETIKGKVSLESSKIDMNDWMSDSPSSTSSTDTASMTVLDIPANIEFIFNTSIGTLIYDDMNIFNVKGSVQIKDKEIIMQNLTMQLLDGSMNITGKYSSANLDKPLFALDLAIRDFDITKTVNTLPTVGKLAPLAKSCTGKYSVVMQVNGDLDKTMSPVLSTLNGGGKLNTSTITIQNFPAFSKVADVLKMPSWKSLNIPTVNPSFKIVNGRVYVDPTELKINGMKGTVAGSNGFDQSIDYTMAMEIPRAMFGGAANSVLNNLVSQANSKGANVSLGDVVPVNLLIGGTVTDPKVSTDLAKQGANVMADLKAKAKEEFDKKKEELEAKAREEADRLKSEAASKIEAEKAKVSAEAERIKKEAEAKAKAKADSLKKAAEEEAKKQAKDLLKKNNPFKK
ncbi:MAG: membrane assembly protein AsmA [Bacteroidetes bacterium]|nr:MAG: membrane assembly protein AsmA [Bacteroidota bacterium]